MLNFVVPVDGSEPSAEAIKQLLKYLGWMKDDVDIHLLNVQPRIPYGKRVTSVVGRDRIARYQQEDGETALKPAKKALDKAGVAYRCSIGIGEPAEVIVQYAIKNGCDQILMGTRGMGSLSGLVLGSIATKVIELSPVPVVLMKKRGSAAKKR
jgi:nucleotide-binding universal stress UspA family protein